MRLVHAWRRSSVLRVGSGCRRSRARQAPASGPCVSCQRIRGAQTLCPLARPGTASLIRKTPKKFWTSIFNRHRIETTTSTPRCSIRQTQPPPAHSNPKNRKCSAAVSLILPLSPSIHLRRVINLLQSNPPKPRPRSSAPPRPRLTSPSSVPSPLPPCSTSVCFSIRLQTLHTLVHL